MANEAALRGLDLASCHGLSIIDTEGKAITVPRTSEMPVLGILLDQQGGTPAALEYRLTAANAHFWARKSQLTCKRISLRARLLRLYTTVMASLLWGAGGWLLSVSCLNRIETFELSLLRRVIQVPRLVTENWVDYLKRSANVARGLLQKWGIDCLAVRVLTRIHGWSGHLVRLPATSPQARALKFRNEEWWAHTQELGNSWDPLNRSGWRHSRPGRFSRWEHQLTRVLRNWAQTALDRSSWRLTLYTFLKTSLALLGARNCANGLLRTPVEAPDTTVAVPNPASFNSSCSLLARLGSDVSLWGAALSKPCHRIHMVCLGDNLETVNRMLGKWSCTEPSLRGVRDAAGRTLKKLSAALRVPWHKLVSCISRKGNARAVGLADEALTTRSFTEVGNPVSWWKLAAHRPVIFRANFADVSKGSDCAFGICISMQCEGDDDDWIEIFSCSVFLGGCCNGSLCAMQSCGCALLALASLLSSRPVRS